MPNLIKTAPGRYESPDGRFVVEQDADEAWTITDTKAGHKRFIASRTKLVVALGELQLYLGFEEV